MLQKKDQPGILFLSLPVGAHLSNQYFTANFHLQSNPVSTIGIFRSNFIPELDPERLPAYKIGMALVSETGNGIAAKIVGDMIGFPPGTLNMFLPAAF